MGPLGGLCLGFCTDYRYKTAMNCFGALMLGTGIYGLQGAVILRIADTFLGVTFGWYLLHSSISWQLSGFCLIRKWSNRREKQHFGCRINRLFIGILFCLPKFIPKCYTKL